MTPFEAACLITNVMADMDVASCDVLIRSASSALPRTIV
jgi:hypothetical protein